MIRLIIVSIVTLVVLPLQAQQAGDAASTDTEGTFQALIDACDDVDALMLRARIRLQLPRTTKEAATQAEQLLEQGFATCGSGDIDTAKTQLSEALSIAEAGAAEKFSVEESATKPVSDAAAEELAQNSGEASQGSEENKKPWWKIW